MKKHTSEDKLQAECYQWAYNSFPALRGLLFSVPNGGTRDVREAMKLRATGLTAGIPDMVLVRPLMGFEFKTISGSVSPAQKKIHQSWRNAGIPVHIIRTVEEFQGIIKEVIQSTHTDPLAQTAKVTQSDPTTITAKVTQPKPITQNTQIT